MRKIRLVVALTAALYPVATHAADSVSRAALDRDIPPVLAANGIPSVSIAQIHDGHIALTVAYGDQSANVRATTATLYNIASLTKPLTAETILRLISKGAFGLDDPISATWTDPDIANDPRAKSLTLRILLSHRSGFPNWRDRAVGLRFQSSPGTIGYSGEGYEYAAHFAEKKTGKPFEVLAQSNLFDIEGMHDASYVRKAWFKGRIALPVDGKGKVLEPFLLDKFNAADGVYTTAGDYAKFMIGVLRDTGLRQDIALARNSVQASTRDKDCVGAVAATCPEDEGFGLGWQVMMFKDATLMMHTGKDDGLFTFAYLDRTSGDGTVILTNGDNGGAVVLPILDDLHARKEFVAFLRAQVH
jgi:CubicO group peptidase (beta-lactamase class C family)